MTVRRGPLYMIVAGGFFTVMVASVKVARADLGAVDIVLYRACVSTPVAFLLAAPSGLVVRRPALLLLRSLLGFGAMTCFFTAAGGLAIADLQLIGKLQPIGVAVLAPWLLGAGERSPTTLWIVLGGGLAGSVLLLGPDLAVGSLSGLWALAATGFSATAHLLVRRLGRTEAVSTQVFWFQLATLALAFLVVGARDGTLPSMPPAGLWAPLVVCGLATVAGQASMTKAYSLDRASTVAAASYLTPLFGVAADVLAFGSWPRAHAWLGGLLVMGSGLWLLFGDSRTAPDARRAGRARA